MKELSNALITELGLTITRPGYLIQIGFTSYTYKLSTLGSITWNGDLWVESDVKISGIGQDGSGAITGSITLGNTDGLFGAVVLTYGVSDVPIDIYAVYAGATAQGDPVKVFSGVADGADIGTRLVTLNLTSQGNNTLYSPRVFINKAAGFSHLMPRGTPIPANGENYILGGN